MATVHENFPAGGIITNGLGLNACTGMIITTQFHLFGFEVVVPPVQTPFEGGGSFPLAPGEIQGFYKPVQPGELPFLTPYDYDPLAKKKRHVIMSVTFGERKIEKEYLVSDKRANTVVSVINLLNNTKQKISVVAAGLKRITTSAIIRIKNLRRKR